MIELLSIWAACFFWVMVFAEMYRKERHTSIYKYYISDMYVVIAFLVAPIQFSSDIYLYIHKGSI